MRRLEGLCRRRRRRRRGPGRERSGDKMKYQKYLTVLQMAIGVTPSNRGSLLPLKRRLWVTPSSENPNGATSSVSQGKPSLRRIKGRLHRSKSLDSIDFCELTMFTLPPSHLLGTPSPKPPPKQTSLLFSASRLHRSSTMSTGKVCLELVTVKHHPLFPHRARRFKCVIKGIATTSVKESGFDSDCCLTVVLCVKIGMVEMLTL
ncbi:uncharacterized protein LOC132360058 [Balaenoptera ricei]|uniref:uncharacterized protein LOC132360058 n=1 Tax=Balaenoptera ricei TaxID=2746895 RepID=UPI0028BEDC23|nr:uncharacterized protein LOC132360058 [Balaenoptera ricei]